MDQRETNFFNDVDSYLIRQKRIYENRLNMYTLQLKDYHLFTEHERLNIEIFYLKKEISYIEYLQYLAKNNQNIAIKKEKNNAQCKLFM